MATKPKFTTAAFAQRLFVSLALVFSAYNPTGYSLAHWIARPDSGRLAVKVLVLLLLGLAFYAVLRVTFGAFRRSGTIVAALFGVLLSMEVVHHAFGTAPAWLAVQYIALLALVVVIAFGISWGNITTRLSGQLQKRYVR